jgi:hypothetical protein
MILLHFWTRVKQASRAGSSLTGGDGGATVHGIGSGSGEDFLLLVRSRARKQGMIGMAPCQSQSDGRSQTVDVPEKREFMTGPDWQHWCGIA